MDIYLLSTPNQGCTEEHNPRVRRKAMWQPAEPFCVTGRRCTGGDAPTLGCVFPSICLQLCCLCHGDTTELWGPVARILVTGSLSLGHRFLWNLVAEGFLAPASTPLGKALPPWALSICLLLKFYEF